MPRGVAQRKKPVYTLSVSDRGVSNLAGRVWGSWTAGISEDVLQSKADELKRTAKFGRGNIVVYDLHEVLLHRARRDDLDRVCKGLELPPAKIMVIRHFVETIAERTGLSLEETRNAFEHLNYNKKDLSNYGTKKLVNSRSRWTTMLFPGEDVVVTDEQRLEGESCISDLNKLPLVQACIRTIEEEFGVSLPVAEVNNYFDGANCGLGWHGDAERTINVIMRFGPTSFTMPLNIQWFYNQSPFGDIMKLPLHEGDCLVFSAKALGTDFKDPPLKRPTLRHAVGRNAQPKPTLQEKRAKKRRASDDATPAKQRRLM